ncbi:MAG: peptide chain release factor N(5)-glutamine methyltransferase [Desulfobacterales bacterium]|nr:peptide chain release factor N(5)-glutamine methyltransferase [Desulfobacterales bacterium]
MLAFCLNCDRLELIKNPEKNIHETDLTVFDQLVTRRLRGEPVAYLTGRKDFWSFTLEINPSVLIPRPDTEVIVEEALAVWRAQAYSRPSILDVGTGSGAIALALAKEIPEAKITATDISAPALQLAQKNARALGVQHLTTFLQGNLFQPVHDNFDIIVSNPPYIGAQEYEALRCRRQRF